MDKSRHHNPRLRTQRGVAAVEFAICAVFFFTFVFAIIELSRALYLWNTMTEVTRRAARAAAVTDFSDAAKMNSLRRAAMFGGQRLPMAGEITDDYLKIDFLQANGTPASPMPFCPTHNLVTCTGNPNGSNCIRFVRVRLCRDSAGPDGCTPVPYTSLLRIMDGFLDANTFQFPSFTTITPVASFGRRPDVSSPCP